MLTDNINTRPGDLLPLDKVSTKNVFHSKPPFFLFLLPKYKRSGRLYLVWKSFLMILKNVNSLMVAFHAIFELIPLLYKSFSYNKIESFGHKQELSNLVFYKWDIFEIFTWFVCFVIKRLWRMYRWDDVCCIEEGIRLSLHLKNQKMGFTPNPKPKHRKILAVNTRLK